MKSRIDFKVHDYHAESEGVAVDRLQMEMTITSIGDAERASLPRRAIFGSIFTPMKRAVMVLVTGSVPEVTKRAEEEHKAIEPSA